jgi:hypothetical protein
MNPEDFRRLYDYHFALNRLWQRSVAPLPAQQFCPQDYALHTMGKL